MRHISLNHKQQKSQLLNHVARWSGYINHLKLASEKLQTQQICSPVTFHSTGLVDRTKVDIQKNGFILKSLHAYPRIKSCYSFFSLKQPANRKLLPLSPQEFQPLLGHLTCQDHTKLCAILEGPTQNPQKPGTMKTWHTSPNKKKNASSGCRRPISMNKKVSKEKELEFFTYSSVRSFRTASVRVKIPSWGINRSNRCSGNQRPTLEKNTATNPHADFTSGQFHSLPSLWN